MTTTYLIYKSGFDDLDNCIISEIIGFVESEKEAMEFCENCDTFDTYFEKQVPVYSFKAIKQIIW
jgi:hypothetical protein